MITTAIFNQAIEKVQSWASQCITFNADNLRIEFPSLSESEANEAIKRAERTIIRKSPASTTVIPASTKMAPDTDSIASGAAEQNRKAETPAPAAAVPAPDHTLNPTDTHKDRLVPATPTAARVIDQPLSMAARGIPVALLPWKEKGSKTRGWQNLATTSAKEIIKQAENTERFNYACVAKANQGGFIFLDDDGGVRAEYEKLHGPLLQTLKAQSCNGSFHYYFKHSAASLAYQASVDRAFIGEPKKDGKGELWSLRMHNAYVVGPGSVVVNKQGVDSKYKIVFDAPIIEIPDALLSFLTERYKKSGTSKVSASVTGDKIPYGQHDSELTRIAGKLRHDGMEAESIATTLAEICEKRCEGYGSDYREMCKKIAQSVCKYPVGKDDRVYIDGVPAEVRAAQAASGSAGKKLSSVSPRKLTLVTASSLTPKHVRWFWDNKILANKPNVLFGEPGLGKGFVGVDFIARMTTAVDFFDSQNLNPVCDAIVCCSEDSWDETILPRLMIAGANTGRVHFLKMEHEIAGSVEEGLMALDEDLPALARLIEEKPAVKVILIDPLATYMGVLDPNKDKEVRPVYTALKTFAEKHGVCFILIAHPNKNEEASAINRLSGAKALTSVFRNTWLIEKDPDDKTGRLMLSVKGNLAGEDSKTGLKFRVENVAETGIIAEGGEMIRNIGHLVWLDKTDKSADEALQDAAGGGKKYVQKREELEAQELLKQFLGSGARLARDFHKQIVDLDVSEWTLRKAKTRLGVEERRIGGPWYWALDKAGLDAKEAEIQESWRVHFGAGSEVSFDAETQDSTDTTKAWLLALLNSSVGCTKPVPTIKSAAESQGRNWESIKTHRSRWGVESFEENGVTFWEALNTPGN